MNIELDEKASIKESIKRKLMSNFGKRLENATDSELYKAVAMVLRDEIMPDWSNSVEKLGAKQPKTLYYLSAEFLTGKFFETNLTKLYRLDTYRETCAELGISLDELIDEEPEPGIGNGGLGRLAASFLETMSTLGYPAFGCGIRYEYGFFNQRIEDGYQVEYPDNWLENDSVWAMARPEEQVEVRFGGNIIEEWQEGRLKTRHEGYKSIFAVPCDIPIVGYDSKLVNTLRLWRSKSPRDMDLFAFNRGKHVNAVESKIEKETISKVLYPEDNTYEGKRLRLKQYYFLVSATVQTIIRDSKGVYPIEELPNRVAIQINDTHPALVIPELMRILLDEEYLSWEDAWDITVRTCAYTNHTVMSEALERWSVDLIAELLPRIYMIIKEIDDRHIHQLNRLYSGQREKINRMSIINYGQVNMANLCILGSHSVNGVSQLHGEILKRDLFNDFYTLYPNKFKAITNGISHRRWLMQANPKLSELIVEAIGDSWMSTPKDLIKLREYTDDKAFKDNFAGIKRENKEKLSKYILENTGIKVDPSSIFDVQVKRIHEYKRQLLNALHIIYLYQRILDNPNENIYPRTFIFAGKAAPGYSRAKLIIKLINAIGRRVNNDPRVAGRIKVAFLEEYNVSLAQLIIPAADVSEQISTAGKEASGTGNMKLMLNGALTLGTLDGANIEIMNAVGRENIFIFGLTAEQVDYYYRNGGYDPRELYEKDMTIRRVVDALIDGTIFPDMPDIFRDLYGYLLYAEGNMADRYMVLKDFASYREAQTLVDRQYKNQDIWRTKAIINTANGGAFSSDLTIENYNQEIWHLSKFDM